MIEDMQGLPVKNAFVHFRFVDDVDVHSTRRCRSEPPFSSSRWEQHNLGCMSRSDSSTLTCSRSFSNQEKECDGVDQSSKTPEEKRWSQWRPTKATRKAFREYVDSLKEKLSQNPGTFSLDDIEIPKRFARPQTRRKIETILACFLKEYSGAVASAAK